MPRGVYKRTAKHRAALAAANRARLEKKAVGSDVVPNAPAPSEEGTTMIPLDAIPARPTKRAYRRSVAPAHPKVFAEYDVNANTLFLVMGTARIILVIKQK